MLKAINIGFQFRGNYRPYNETPTKGPVMDPVFGIFTAIFTIVILLAVIAIPLTVGMVTIGVVRRTAAIAFRSKNRRK